MKTRLLLLLILTLSGGWIRFQGLSFGLPDLFRPDEEYLVSRAIGFEEDMNPHFAVYPALQMYVQHAALKSTAWWHDKDSSLQDQVREEGIHTAHLSGRRVSAAFGTLTIPALYWATVATYGPVAALVSAAGLSAATLHVRESKYATTDAAATFWLTLAIGSMLRVLSRGRMGDALGAGALTGLALATKYPSGALLAGLAVAHLGARWREGRTLWRVFRDIRPWLTLYAAAVVTFLATPYTFLDWQRTVQAFTFQKGFVANGVGNSFGGWGWDWFLWKVLPDSFGPELALVLGVATAWVILRPRLGTYSLLTFLLVAVIGITQSRYSFYRYALVPLPALLIFLGIFLSDLCQFLQKRMGKGSAILMTAIGVVLLLTPCLIRDYKLNRLLYRKDTRTMAREWIEKNLPAGEALAASAPQTAYGKPQLGSRHTYVRLGTPHDLKRLKIRWVLSDSDVLPFYSPGVSPEQEDWLATKALLRFSVDPRKPDTPTPNFDQNDAFYVPLRHASSIKRPGPRIRIWEIPEH